MQLSRLQGNDKTKTKTQRAKSHDWGQIDRKIHSYWEPSLVIWRILRRRRSPRRHLVSLRRRGGKNRSYGHDDLFQSWTAFENAKHPMCMIHQTRKPVDPGNVRKRCRKSRDPKPKAGKIAKRKEDPPIPVSYSPASLFLTSSKSNNSFGFGLPGLRSRISSSMRGSCRLRYTSVMSALREGRVSGLGEEREWMKKRGRWTV